MFALFLIQIALGYNCPSTCQRPACVCAAQAPPLPIDQTPMMVTITWDDAVNEQVGTNILEVTNSYVNPNRCRLPSTFFVSTKFTDFNWVQRFYSRGNEIAAHTVNHPNMTTDKNPLGEIRASRNIISYFTGIPMEEINGFRHPFLAFTKSTFDAVFQAGCLYESSITQSPTSAWWPHTLDYGMPYSATPCDTCPAGESFVYPGKWVIPMYSIVDQQGAVYSVMDTRIIPNDESTYDTALTLLKSNFDLHYQQKLPFGLYWHSAQIVSWGLQHRDRLLKLLNDFVSYTVSKPDVWYVTNQQLIKYVQQPVPASQMKDLFPCKPLPISTSNPEICDGIDNNENGQTDEGLVKSCLVNGLSFSTCFDCPQTYPNVSEWQNKDGVASHSACTDQTFWDPVGQKCVAMQVTFDTEQDKLVTQPIKNNKATSNDALHVRPLLGLAAIYALRIIYRML